ncbi:MAG: hypothetical protein R3B48_22510 [Kofleriaceae bacterium]
MDRRNAPREPATEDAGRPDELAENLNEGINVAMIQWMLSLSPEQRLDVLQSFLDRVDLLEPDWPSAELEPLL